MKTDDLIAALAADTTPAASPLARALKALVPALSVVAVAVLALWRVRPDLAEAMQGAALFKTLTPALIALAALVLTRALARPEDGTRRDWAPVLGLLAALAVALVYGLARDGFAGAVAALDTRNTLTCLISVPILALLPLAAMLWALRAGAPAHPARTGAVAGLVAGAAAAAVYSLHCPQDTLMFFTLAYSAPVLLITGLGGVLGARLLRW